MSHGANSLTSIFFALGANLSIAVVKFVSAVITNSGSMLAESVHSFADCGNQGLLLLGIHQAKRPPSPDHPLGFGKSTYFWSFIVSIMLFSMGGLFSIYEGVHKLSLSEEVKMPFVAVGVLVFSLIAESFSLVGCVREINKVRGKRSFRRWFCETRQSELLVIFGEDVAALAGLSLALVAVSLSIVTGNPVFDAAGSIVIGVLLVIVAFFIGLETKALLIGQGVEKSERDEMISFLEKDPGVERVYNLLTLQLGSDVMVAVKAKMREGLSSTKLVEDINRCEISFRKSFPKVLWLFFEPDSRE